MISRIGLGQTNSRNTSAPKPANHIHGAIAAIARPPSSGTTGSRLKRFRKNPVKASAFQNSSPDITAGGADARLGERVAAQRLRPDRGAQERDEHGRAGLHALAPQLDDVPHLVDE